MARFASGLVLAGFAGLAILTGPSAASAQQQDLWRSPTGNIRCAYVNQQGVACYTRNNGRYAQLRSFGNSSVGRTSRGLPAGRVLHYGAVWRKSTFRCQSRRDGMRCWSTHTGRGFHINRDRAWRW